jgi:hypothetical protein
MPELLGTVNPDLVLNECAREPNATLAASHYRENSDSQGAQLQPGDLWTRFLPRWLRRRRRLSRQRLPEGMAD